MGAYMLFPSVQSGAGYTNISSSFITYRAGVQQEMISGSSTAVGNIDGGGSKTFYGGKTTLPFDSVQVIASLSGTSTPATVNVFEICGNR